MTKEQSERVLQLLGLTPDDFARLRAARNMKEGDQLLQTLKTKAKKGYHKAALELHPDRNPGDAAKAEMFRLVCEAHDEIQNLKVRSPEHLIYKESIRFTVKVKPKRG